MILIQRLLERVLLERDNRAIVTAFHNSACLTSSEEYVVESDWDYEPCDKLYNQLFTRYSLKPENKCVFEIHYQGIVFYIGKCDDNISLGFSYREIGGGKWYKVDEIR